MVATLRHLFAHILRGFPHTLAASRTPLERLREQNFAEKYRAASPFKLATIAVLRTFLYPFVAIGAIGSAIRHLPSFGVPARWADFPAMYVAALFRNIPPVEYLMFGFADPAVRTTSGDYLYWMDQPALQWLNRRRGADNRDVQDKARFAAICQDAGLPHAAVVAEFRGGRLLSGPAPENLPASDLWTKPTTGSGGQGCRLWHRECDGSLRSGGEVLPVAEWVAALSASDCIVQQPLPNHPEMKGLTSGAAVVLRMVTVLDREGTTTLIGSSVALPQGKADSTGGALGCVPDLGSGTICKVSVAGGHAGSTHPDTGRRLIGSVLPCWQKSRELVLHAHRVAFAAFASLGWDVVVTPNGPVLLEANSGWGTMGQQMDFGPLGRSPLGKVAADEFERTA